MNVSAVVPVWNGRPLLARLLDTLEAQTLRAEEVIAVDNGSTDGAAELAAERGCRVIAMGRNAGFAAAMNRGIGVARSEWVAVLNSDVELAPDYFEKLTAAGAPFATGKILDARRNGVVDATFDLTCRGGTTWRAGSGRADGAVFAEGRTIASAAWTAAVFRAELFREVGMLDESFESYLEDVEFGLRCAALGVRGRYVPEARAWHHGSASLGRWHAETVRRMARNQVWIAGRYGAWWPSLVAQALWGAVALRHGRGAAWMRGVLEGWSRREKSKNGSGLPGHLEKNDREIRALQAATGFDLYWRLYFLFTGGGAK
jgi:GT2 family glycosyltransferase